MLRFPNPGSTIANFVDVYRAAFERLQGRVFSLDNIVAAIVDANLATSSGYMGEEAISRSTRPDRSRDPLYNQLKMYAELFRSLGWLHPTEKSALNYTFTLLGHQIVKAEDHYLPLLGETALGIAYPSRILTVKGEFDLRPFAFILRTMLESDGMISRDEMIVGPLSAPSDRDAEAAKHMAEIIHKVRENSAAIQIALTRVSQLRGIQRNTLMNYTRWPIAILRDCGWVEEARIKFRSGGSYKVFKLTTWGEKTAQRVSDSADIRLDQLDGLSSGDKAALSIYAHYNMLDRAGFDLAAVSEKLQIQVTALSSARKKLGLFARQPLLFSPFQSLSIADIREIFPTRKVAEVAGESKGRSTETPVGRG